MTSSELFNVLNSWQTFLLMAAIAIGVWILILKKDSRPYPKSAKR